MLYAKDKHNDLFFSFFSFHNDPLQSRQIKKIEKG